MNIVVKASDTKFVENEEFRELLIRVHIMHKIFSRRNKDATETGILLT
jgi:hypothetical protein